MNKEFTNKEPTIVDLTKIMLSDDVNVVRLGEDLCSHTGVSSLGRLLLVSGIGDQRRITDPDKLGRVVELSYHKDGGGR